MFMETWLVHLFSGIDSMIDHHMSRDSCIAFLQWAVKKHAPLTIKSWIDSLTKFAQTCNLFHKIRFHVDWFMKNDLDVDDGRVGRWIPWRWYTDVLYALIKYFFEVFLYHLLCCGSNEASLNIHPTLQMVLTWHSCLTGYGERFLWDSKVCLWFLICLWNIQHKILLFSQFECIYNKRKQMR